MWPLSPRWRDPLSPAAPGKVLLSEAGLRARVLGHGPRTLIFLHGLGARFVTGAEPTTDLPHSAALSFSTCSASPGLGGQAERTM